MLKKKTSQLSKKLDATSEKLDTTASRVDSISEKLETTITRLDTAIKKLDETHEQVVSLTEKVDGEIIPALELHTKYFKQIAGKFEIQEKQNEKDGENILRLDKRLNEVESNQGIQPPSELFIVK